MLESWRERWKESGGVALRMGKGGDVKWLGEMERVVQEESVAVDGAPRRREIDSERDWERRRSWAERKVGDDVVEVEVEGGGLLGVREVLSGWWL